MFVEGNDCTYICGTRMRSINNINWTINIDNILPNYLYVTLQNYCKTFAGKRLPTNVCFFDHIFVSIHSGDHLILYFNTTLYGYYKYIFFNCISQSLLRYWKWKQKNIKHTRMIYWLLKLIGYVFKTINYPISSMLILMFLSFDVYFCKKF